MNRRSWGMLLLAAAIVGLCGGGSWFVYRLQRTIGVMKEAEQRLHAGLFAAEAVHEYLVAHGYEQWPSRWADLEPYAHGRYGWLKWPADAQEFPKYVMIDFQVSIEAALTADPDTFEGIRPTPGPIYVPGHVQNAVAYVLDKLREHHAGAGDAQHPEPRDQEQSPAPKADYSPSHP